MKKNKLTALIVAGLLSGSMLFNGVIAEAAIHVNPVDGLSQNFIKGADISMLKQLETVGAKFYDNGVEKDGMQILKEHGMNWVRLRIWNNPQNVGGGNTDETKALELAQRAQKMGLKVLLDFHYSDWWADPGKQVKPAAWEKDHGTKLDGDVYAFTSKVLKDFKAQGINVDMVQVGNELNNGMLWPDGQLNNAAGGGYKSLASLLKSGIKAVRENAPEAKVMVHLANGGDNGLYHSFFDELIGPQKLTDFDIIGLSFYPCWHGTVDQLQKNMDDISVRYNKDVIVVETAGAFTLDNADKQKNAFGANEEKLSGYKATVQGQATSLRNVIDAVAKVPNKRGLGVFYWEPDWIPNDGAPWKTGEGNEWENQALFDFKGNALESIDVYNKVSDPANVYVQSTIREINPVMLSIGINQSVELPKSVSAVYSDDSVRDTAVAWDEPAVVYGSVGDYTVSGTVPGTQIKAYAVLKVTDQVNFVKNAGFETGDLSAWVITGDSGAVNISGSSGDVRGKKAMHYWADKAFYFTAKQTITGLENGKYTLSAWTQGGGGEKSIALFAENYGGGKVIAAVKNDGWNKWYQWVIKDIEVTNGQITVGLDTQAAPGNWGSFDDVELYKQ